MKHEALPIKGHLRKLEEIHQSLRAREERLEKRKRVFFFSRRKQEKYKCSIFSERVSKTQSVYFSRV
jgi:hypothetical protein